MLELRDEVGITTYRLGQLISFYTLFGWVELALVSIFTGILGYVTWSFCRIGSQACLFK